VKVRWLPLLLLLLLLLSPLLQSRVWSEARLPQTVDAVPQICL
jgi:hypothetical protein